MKRFPDSDGGACADIGLWRRRTTSLTICNTNDFHAAVSKPISKYEDRARAEDNHRRRMLWREPRVW